MCEARCAYAFHVARVSGRLARKWQRNTQNGLEAPIRHPLATRPTCRSLRALFKKPLVWRICIRLGMGKCLRWARACVLPQRIGRCSIYACTRISFAGGRWQESHTSTQNRTGGLWRKRVVLPAFAFHKPARPRCVQRIRADATSNCAISLA